MSAIDLGNTTITATGMTVTVEKSSGIKAWLALWTHQDDDFGDGRGFVAQTRDLEPDEMEDPKLRPTKSGTKTWEITVDGLYEFGNCPTEGKSQTRGFLRVENGTVTRLPYSEKKALVSALPTRPRAGRRNADRNF